MVVLLFGFTICLLVIMVYLIWFAVMIKCFLVCSFLCFGICFDLGGCICVGCCLLLCGVMTFLFMRLIVLLVSFGICL